ncbi:ATP-binding protein [Cellulomonas palmilytica]|uniref:ATP-binding protein n=1 Tax=Cellulomonas palmilytica TaxID=2608402 RepID=UPI001F37301D|nr:ATP-binding protein [Cellulomonas palmilytica]UJP40450.1 ATP-binding protein [Cellulomonas palmilytica]
MDPVLNPYTPNAGARPDVVVGRDDQLAAFDVLLKRIARGRTEQSMIFTGLRGVGKTVLLGQFREVALTQDWSVIEYEVVKHDDSAFRMDIAARLRMALLELEPRTRWSDRFKKAAAALASFTVSVDAEGTWQAGLNVDAIEGLADHGDLSMDLTDVLLAVGEAAQDKRRGVVLLLDEIQFLSKVQLESLIVALHKVVQRAVPITLVGAGLPQIAELAGDAKSYAERLLKFPSIGNLEEQDAKRALNEPAIAEGVEYTEDALDLAFELTGGYPYFIQELGHAVWGAASTAPITRADVQDACELYEAKLDASFFRVRLDRATELQSAYLRAMAQLGPEPQKAGEVASVLGRESTQLGPTRAELIDMGLLYTPQHGYAAFTVPHFDKFMLRAMPNLVVPPLKRRSKGVGS